MATSVIDAAHETGRRYGTTVPAGPNRADHISQIAWNYAFTVRPIRGRSLDRRAIAEAFIAGAA